MGTRHRHGGQRGFTLMEALVALVIVSLALGVLFQVVSGSLRLGGSSREAFTFQARARTMFEETLPQRPDWERMAWSNATGDWRWSLEVHPVALRESLERTGLDAGLDLFRFAFRYEDLRTGRTAELSSYRSLPAGSLRLVLERGEARLDWDEHDRFMEALAP